MLTDQAFRRTRISIESVTNAIRTLTEIFGRKDHLVADQLISPLDTNNDGSKNAVDLDDDADGVLDDLDNCDVTPNALQLNQDLDTFGDACDADIDGGGVLNGFEEAAGTNPRNSLDDSFRYDH